MTYGVNAPIGLVPHSYLNGALWTGQISNYFITSGYNTATLSVANGGGVFLNDPIVPQADGSIGLAIAGDANPVIGSFQGCFYIDSSGNPQYSKYWPNSTVTFGSNRAIAYVADTVNLLYDIQYNATPGLDFTALNNNALLVQGNGSTTTGYSGWSFGTAAAVNATYQLKIIRLTPYIGNLFNSQGPAGVFPYNNFLCLINNDPYKGGTGTPGI